MIKIHMFKASYGDSLLVQVEKKGKETINIMIDCGFFYEPNILPNLKRLLKKQALNRFVITHYDSDHINSAAKFLEENGNYNEEKIVKIDQIWLNTFKHLQFSNKSAEELNNAEKVKVKNYVSEMSSKVTTENTEGDIGAKQATILGKKILEKNYPWNIDTDEEAICIENLKDVDISEDVKLHLLTPNKERLENLEDEFISELSLMGLDPNTDTIFDDAFELFNLNKEKDNTNGGNISSSEKTINPRTIDLFSKGENYVKDNAIGNGSSISFILEVENKKVLFLADAFAEDVIESIKKKYTEESEYPIFFDAVKISHHGSFRNNSPELFKVIDSNNFLFSTNGKHQSHVHPDVETISCIINRKLPDKVTKRNLIFNYDLFHLKDFKNENLKEEFKYEIKVQEETIV